MTDIRRAMMRKFGPLPAWAWAIILGGAVYFVRRSSSLRAGSVTGVPTGQSPGISTATTPRDPVTLAPGESVYDPNTGQLIGTHDDQRTGNDTGGGTDSPRDTTPITLQPGETVYDPATGQVSGTPAGTPAEPTRRIQAAPKKKTTKRTVKGKPQHDRTKPVSRHTHGAKQKPRGSGSHQTPTARNKPTHTEPPSRHTSKPTHSPGRTRQPSTGESPTQRQRPRTPMVQHPAMRQRPAAPTVVHHDTQRTAPNPARAPAGPSGSVGRQLVGPPAPPHKPPPKRKR